MCITVFMVNNTSLKPTIAKSFCYDIMNSNHMFSVFIEYATLVIFVRFELFYWSHILMCIKYLTFWSNYITFQRKHENHHQIKKYSRDWIRTNECRLQRAMPCRLATRLLIPLRQFSKGHVIFDQI